MKVQSARRTHDDCAQCKANDVGHSPTQPWPSIRLNPSVHSLQNCGPSPVQPSLQAPSHTEAWREHGQYICEQAGQNDLCSDLSHWQEFLSSTVFALCAIVSIRVFSAEDILRDLKCCFLSQKYRLLSKLMLYDYTE